MNARCITSIRGVMNRFLYGLVLILFSSLASVHATVDIADAPLHLTTSVEPNIMFIIDDSGSMQWETMPDELTNMFNVGCCDGYMMWVYPRVDGLHGAGDYGAGGIRVPSFNQADIMARAFRSTAVNTMYYSPAVTYRPWANADGTLMPNANPAAAPNRPLFPGFGTRNLTADNTQIARWVDNRVNAHLAVNRTFYPAVYSTYIGPDIADMAAAIADPGSALWLNASYNWTEIRATIPLYTGEGRENRTDCAAAPTCTYAEEIQNFANWYSYHRNRIFTSRAGIGQAFADFGEEMRVGYARINTGLNTVDSVGGRAVVRGVREFTGSSKDAFYQNLYEDPIPPQGTPLRRALEGAGQYFSRNDVRGPWSDTPGVATTDETSGDHLTCRQSFSILMTDGYTSGGAGNAAVHDDRRANTDGTNAQNTINVHPDGATMNYTYSPADPYQDNRGDTLADVAMYYWKRDLRSDLDNRVPVSARDEAFWQHMVTYGVALGVAGSLEPDDVWQAALDGTAVTWPDPSFGNINCGDGPAGTCAARVDDLLHAAVNSRGGFFSASDPDTFANELKSVLLDIVARVRSSSTSSAASSATLRSDTLLYTAAFHSDDWSGMLTGYELDANGLIDEVNPAWQAEDILATTSPAVRNLFTNDGADSVALQYANLSDAQKAALDRTTSGAVDGMGVQRINWLRGTEHPDFRVRSGSGSLRLLGDIVNSNPEFVAKLNMGYRMLGGLEGSSYTIFRTTAPYKDRPDALYVAANDGMLHAFHAGSPFIDDPMDINIPPAKIMDPDGGKELFAYMPSELLLPASGDTHAKINALMEKDYTHRYFNDGTPAVGDAYWGGSWKTVLVGSMGSGGRTVYALNVTDPANFTAADVLWEFTDADLGYNIGQPSIIRMNNGEWAVVFGNGYNSDNHRSVLYIVRISDGGLLAKIDTGAGSAGDPNGMAAPVATDLPNGDLIAKRIYAGDLHGNLWSFDVSSATDTEWEDPANRRMLFVARDSGGVRQPITASPRIVQNPENLSQRLVVFGTGGYFRSQDANSTQVQTLYGIMDRDETIAGRSVLQEQTINWQGVHTYGDGSTVPVREVSFVEMVGTNDKGWYLDLVYAGQQLGERVIAQASFPSGSRQPRVLFSTLIPDQDPCGSGRGGFLMSMMTFPDPNKIKSVFDLNRDGQIDNDDMVDDRYISGMGGTRGERLTLIRRDGVDMVFTGDGRNLVETVNTAGRAGRQSWRQYR